MIFSNLLNDNNINKKLITAKKGIEEKDMKPIVAITGVSSDIGEVTARIISDNGSPVGRMMIVFRGIAIFEFRCWNYPFIFPCKFVYNKFTRKVH